MVGAANLGFPRIGAHRELKKAVEGYWEGRLNESDLRASARALRAAHWRRQREGGLDVIPSNDFSFYDPMLDTCAMVGAVPERFAWDGEDVDLDTYFAMARGTPTTPLEADPAASNPGARAMARTTWFDTNVHVVVPEIAADTTFALSSTHPIDAYAEAQSLGIDTRPVLVGPVTFLMRASDPEGAIDPLDRLDALVPVYADVLRRLDAAGCPSVQFDEPALVLDLSEAQRDAFAAAYDALAQASDVDRHVATYFGGLGDALDLALDLPVAGLHVDLVRAPEQLDRILERSDAVPDDSTLSLGVVDGRNVWRADLDACLDAVDRAVDVLGSDRVVVAPSCSLVHVPVDLATEPPGLDEAVRGELAFAVQKIDEVVALADRVDGAGDDATDALFDRSRAVQRDRAASRRFHDADVRARVNGIDAAMTRRETPYAQRRPLQRERMDLPLLPTTTVGSFPQTDDVREMRRKRTRGEISDDEYEAFLEGQIDDVIAAQEDVGLDVLVHGEPERSDNVEYFGRHLDGFACTENGWVQCAGMRCVRPPIIVGDVSRPSPMTVRWLSYAQAQTDRPVKGTLTGPVTMLRRSFVREDRSRADTCRQIALAIRDEVKDLEAAGLPAIQIDEPALRGGRCCANTRGTTT